ncbi:unnamed protein product [Alopecurus aequalis]
MGCAHSKPPRGEQGAAVALCRDRSALLADAIRHRYALADAHRAYATSLRATGAALHDFLRLQPPPPPPPGSPVPILHVRLPEPRKGDPLPTAAKQVDDDGGQIRFPSDDEEDSDDAHIRFPSDDDDDAEPRIPRLEPLPPAAPAPPPPYGVGYAPPLYSYGTGPPYGYGADIGGYGQSFFNISYARSQPPPRSVPYEHRPQSTNATVQYHPGNAPLPGSHYGGYQYQYPQGSGLHQVAASSCEGSVPPPSPPRASTWDFLNPFESVESYYREEPAAEATYLPGPFSKDRQEQGDIPELEDEDVQEEVVNESYNNGNIGKVGLAKEEGRSSASEEPHRKSKSLEENSSTASSMIHDVHVVEKSVVQEHMHHSDAARLPAISGKVCGNDVEVAQEIRLQFELAAKSSAEVSKMLEVGKMPYYQKRSGLKVSSSMMICGRPSMGEEFLQFQEEKAMECGNLSSTLQKLYMWEKKLLDELKTEEKMRMQYDKKREELKVLYERGAEAQMLEAIETFIRKLSTKISVAIQVEANVACHVRMPSGPVSRLFPS